MHYACFNRRHRVWDSIEFQKFSNPMHLFRNHCRLIVLFCIIHLLVFACCVYNVCMLSSPFIFSHSPRRGSDWTTSVCIDAMSMFQSIFMHSKSATNIFKECRHWKLAHIYWQYCILAARSILWVRVCITRMCTLYILRILLHLWVVSQIFTKTNRSPYEITWFAWMYAISSNSSI